LSPDLSAVVDEIYEAAVVPESWRRVLDRMANISGSEGTVLFASSSERSHWLSSEAIDQRIRAWLDSPFIQNNPRGQRLVPRREPRFLTDLDALTLEEMDADPYYQFIRDLGLGWCVGTTVRSPAGDTLVFSCERQYRKGPVERSAVDMLDDLRPHLARAALLSARIGLERARATVHALETLGLPAAVVSPSGRAIAANELLATCAPRLFVGAHDRITFAAAAAHALFAEALASGGHDGTGRSIPVPRDNTGPNLVVHLLPLRGAGRDIFSGASSLLYVTPLTENKAPDVRFLEMLFDLTPAEARVAGLLVEGKSVADIAALQEVTENTVRMQLKAVFGKTGVHRQSQLVSLLGLPNFSPP
jgi:DNA-binding CsgD family transcriptional regulator